MKKMAIKFFLLTETNFHASYLVTEWMNQFAGIPEFMGIAVRAHAEPQGVRALRESLHQQFQGQHELPEIILQKFREVYPGLNKSDQAMIKLFGVPAHAVTASPETNFLGADLNHRNVKQWLSEVSQTAHPFFFIFLDQLLAPWWIDITRSQIMNAHSAVLPYARGMYAIENIALRQDIDYFRLAAGCAIHYIDTGIDTGPIVKRKNLDNPFAFDSIWEVKAASFSCAFDLLVQECRTMLETRQIPRGTAIDPKLRGPNFNSRDFTEEARGKAEEGYLKMKACTSQLVTATTPE